MCNLTESRALSDSSAEPQNDIFYFATASFDSDFVICDYSFVKFIYNEFKFSYNVGYKIVP